LLTPSIWRAYRGLMAAVMHPIYLPFTADQLLSHFAPVVGAGKKNRHLKYYRASIARAKEYDDVVSRGCRPTPAQTLLGRQMEKDERFWVATALMTLYHANGGSAQAETFGVLLERAGLHPPARFRRWADALAGPLDLFFEVNLPSPRCYRKWLRNHLDERVPIPYLREKAAAPGARLEGATHADGMLLARDSKVAVIFEAKVLSDVSTHVTYDVARNQLARTIDVMLEAPGQHSLLSIRKPELTFLVLLTPALMQTSENVNQKTIGLSRLYGWLMPAYRNRDNSLLRQHLPHRHQHEVASAADRLGWASWEDCNAVVPRACPWLTPAESDEAGGSP
jgi:hypothetical protein